MACLTILGAALAEFPQPVRAAETATIAIAGPMVGNSFSVGIQYNTGVKAAIQAVPGGLLLGRELKIQTYDDNCNSAIAEKVALEVVQNPPAVVIGHSCSMATITAAPIYAQHHVLQITPASSNPKVTEMGVGTIFRMIGRDDVQGEVAAARIAERYADKKIGIFYFTGVYSQGLVQNAIQALKRRGIQPTYTKTGTANDTSYIQDIEDFISAGVDVLYLVGGGLDNGVFVRQARQIGAKFQMIGSDTLVSKVFIETAGPEGEHIPFTFTPEAVKLPSSKSAVAAIQKLGQEPVGYTLLAYAATQTWIEGVNRPGFRGGQLV